MNRELLIFPSVVVLDEEIETGRGVDGAILGDSARWRIGEFVDFLLGARTGDLARVCGGTDDEVDCNEEVEDRVCLLFVDWVDSESCGFTARFGSVTDGGSLFEGFEVEIEVPEVFSGVGCCTYPGDVAGITGAVGCDVEGAIVSRPRFGDSFPVKSVRKMTAIVFKVLVMALARFGYGVSTWGGPFAFLFKETVVVVDVCRNRNAWLWFGGRSIELK